MKVLQLNCVFQRGSTGKIVSDIHNALLDLGIESIVGYGHGKKMYDFAYRFTIPLEAKIHSLNRRLGIVLPYGGMWMSTSRLISFIKREKPDIVHLHCMNGSTVNIYKLLEFLAQNKYKTVVTNHAEFYYTGSCEHAFNCIAWTKNTGCENCPNARRATLSYMIDRTSQAWGAMCNAFKKFENNNIIFTAVSPWMRSRILTSTILKRFRCDVVMNGVESKFFHYTPDVMIHNKIKTHGCRKIILHVTAYFNPSDKDDLKGGWYIVELARMLPQFLFIIVAIRQKSAVQYPPNICIWNKIDDQQKLAELYSVADLTVIASKRETFSMIVAESLCCGTPIVGFRAGGPESIAINTYSHFVEFGNLQALSNAILDMIGCNYDKRRVSSEAISKYCKEAMAISYVNIYKDLMKA
ncbi:glycosyltransferase [uncultured Alistipes sp.]|uniref:glycosyltransferase n=1 Tax=uncultured Alistipes sp. TaxID=538949 RepID=UPI0026142628|nr:glycosyltransferase [uncultured Alistipes sp.]